jgi:hypothetical protein
MEDNHYGGRNHVPSIWLRFCRKDHTEFHVNCRRAGVDFSYTPNRSLALVQALKAMLVGMWMVVDSFEKHIRSEMEAQSDGTQATEERSNNQSQEISSQDATPNSDAQR